jgi:hypothetical protein
VAQTYKDAIQSAKTEVVNRQLGSVKVSPKEQLREYEMMRESPAHLSQFFVDQGASLEEMVNYCFEMESKLRNG